MEYYTKNRQTSRDAFKRPSSSTISQTVKDPPQSIIKSSQLQRVKYCCTFNNTIAEVLKERNWISVDDPDSREWDFIWGNLETTRKIHDQGHLEHWQRINHFRNSKELCRKDLMAKNLKKRRKDLEREGRIEEAAAYEFIPTTFLLPREYAIFVEEFKRSGGIWIMKPSGSSQGKGIFLFSKLCEISEWKTEYKDKWSGKTSEKEKEKEYVVQRYLLHPLLIGGKKFDMRLYALVTSFAPLRVYQYRRGFARFTNSRYSSDLDDISNGLMHLTNVAIQQKAENYDERTGGKMELQALKLYLMSRFGIDRIDALFWEIQMIILRSLLAVQPVIINDRHCFELYGYDILIDDNLKPWLIEVNASPSLTANTEDDRQMKKEMLHAMLDIIDMDNHLKGDEEYVSGFDLIFDDGFVEIDPSQCGYSTFLGSSIQRQV